MALFKLRAPVKGHGFLGIQNNMKIRGSLCVSRSRSSANNNQICLLRLKNSPRDILGVYFWSRELLLLLFVYFYLFFFHHLKSGVPPRNAP